MSDALRIILATTIAQDASAANAAHGEALIMNFVHDELTAAADALVAKFDTGADQFFRCTATVDALLQDGRAEIDALTDAADADGLTDEEIMAMAGDHSDLMIDDRGRMTFDFDDTQVLSFARAIIAAHQERAA